MSAGKGSGVLIKVIVAPRFPEFLLDVVTNFPDVGCRELATFCEALFDDFIELLHGLLLDFAVLLEVAGLACLGTVTSGAEDDQIFLGNISAVTILMMLVEAFS